MTKREFLNELRRQAGALSDGEKARLAEYYTEMIDDRMEEGVPEEEAVAALGDPAALASALVPASGASGGGAESVSALANLRIRVTGADVTVRREALANGAAAQLRFSDPSKFLWRMDGDTLEITQPQPQELKFSLRWIQQMITAPGQRVTVALDGGLDGTLDFEGGGSDLKLEGVSFAKAQLITSSGDIELRDVVAAGGIGIDIRTHSGDIKLSKLQAPNLIVNAASGDISGKDVSLSGSLRLETVSGDVQLRRLECDGLDISTSSGDIELDRGRAGAASVRASSGDVELTDLEADPGLSVETSSGDIDLNHCIARQTSLTAASGDIDLRLKPLPCGYDIAVNTVHGDIRIDEALAAAPGAEPPRITAQTVNGDVTAKAGR